MSALPQPQPRQGACQALPEPHGLGGQKMEALGRLVSGVAHDFNNLLTGIVLCSELLLAGLEEDNRLRRFAQEIRMAGVRGTGMIQQLLAVAQQRSVESQPLSLNQVIAEMETLLGRLIGENIQLVSELADDLPQVRMAPAQMQQIILNLVLNARDAMPDGGRITLTTRNHNRRIDGAYGGTVEFEVSDTGCGMDAKTQKRVFEPFFTTKEPGQGTGLGLATVHNAVSNSGGTIEIESEPGMGTRVRIEFPSELRLQAEGRQL